MENSNRYPLVTCITTTYRKFQYLYETLDSIIAQTYPNIELIIGDDGFDNFPQEEIEKYIADHKSDNITNVIVHHRAENKGTVHNRSLCRELANGEYLMGIASDDTFHDAEVVADVVKYFQNTGAPIITCKRQLVDANTSEKLAIMPFKNQQRWMKKLSPWKLYEKISSFCFLTGANTYYTKAFYFIEMGGYDTSYRFMEDYPFYLKILRNDQKIVFFDRVSINYRYGGGISTISHKNNSFWTQMYDDRIHYMMQEIMPYADKMAW